MDPVPAESLTLTLAPSLLITVFMAFVALAGHLAAVVAFFSRLSQGHRTLKETVESLEVLVRTAGSEIQELAVVVSRLDERLGSVERSVRGMQDYARQWRESPG